MPIRDTKLLPESNVAEHLVPAAFATANSLAARPFFVFKPGYGFRVKRLGLSCRTKAGAAGINARIVRDKGVLSSPGLAISATPEETAIAACSYVIAGVAYNLAADATFPFTAAHVVTALKWGVILYQVDAAGTVTTKVPAATPTTAMAYNTEAEAVKAVPAPDALNASLGYLLVNADAGNWVAITDDMTDGSDLTTAEWVNGPFGNTVSSVNTATLAAVGGGYVEATLSDDFRNLVGDEDAFVVLTLTTDGTGALTDPTAVLGIRPFPLSGEAPTFPVVTT